MSGVSVGAVNGARVAYEIHNSNNIQESQVTRRVGNGNIRKRSNSNLQASLSNNPGDHTEPNEHGQPAQRRLYDRTEGGTLPRGKTANRLEVEGQQNTYNRNGSNGNLSNAESDDIPENMYRPDKEDVEGWIHREKLARIENEELQAAGINLPKPRSRSKDALGNRSRTASRDRLRGDYTAADVGVRDGKKRKVSTSAPIHIEEDDNDQRHWDLRTPEEIAADHNNTQTYTTPILRKSGSKIPVLSPNPNHASPDTSDRGSPVTRKRTMSGGSASYEEGLTSSKTRTNNYSWNNEGEGAIQGTRKPSSPTKVGVRSVSGGQGLSGSSKTTVGRKTSVTKAPTAVSGGRPRTRGNDTDRPRTAVNPPEGDPPWLADMYKPDPRLPPDQQLIPTLAKKQRQMQWEEEGLVPKAYDRDFTAIAVHENIAPPISRPAQSNSTAERPEDVESWPLKAARNARNINEPASKATSSSIPATTGGYSTMPKVSSPPMSMTSPRIGSSSNTNVGSPYPNPGTAKPAGPTQQPIQQTQQRMQSFDDDEKAQKKGCSCCIVM